MSVIIGHFTEMQALCSKAHDIFSKASLMNVLKVGLLDGFMLLLTIQAETSAFR